MSPSAPAIDSLAPARDPISTRTGAAERSGRFEIDLAAALAAVLSGESIVRAREPLAPRTTLRVGGAAAVYVEPAQEHDLAAVLAFCRERDVAWMALGRGSNLLVRDGGYRGVVISLTQPAFSAIGCDGLRLRAGAGARLKAVAAAARRHQLGGFEFLDGIPGSVGGALRMNAGAMGAWTFELVERVRCMDRLGRVTERPAGELAVGYRRCAFLAEHLALEAVLRGEVVAAEVIRRRCEDFNQRRWKTQPPQPSAGCIFKNPAAIPAGKLVEELGFKGQRVGGALVSPVHGNFIVNTGGATARDVLTLIERIRDKARTERSIDLETEVEIVGEDLPADAPSSL